MKSSHSTRMRRNTCFIAVRNKATRLVLVFIFLAMTAYGQAPGGVVADERGDRWNLVPATEFFEEGDTPLTIDEVLSAPWQDRFKPVSAESVNFGLQRRAFWFRVAVRNGGGNPATYYMEISNARIKRADFYAPGLEGAEAHQQAGTSLPVSERSFPYRHGVFSLVLEPGATQTLYLRVYHRGSYRFGLSLWEESAFLTHHTLRSGFFGMFYGALAIMFLFNLVLSVLFKDRSFLWLSMLILCVGLYMVAYQRIDAQYLWPERTNISGSRVNVIFGVGLFAAICFSRCFLDLARHAPRWNLVYRVFAGLSLVLCVDIVIEGIWTDWLLQIVGGTAPILFLGGAITRIRQGYRLAWGYLIAWSLACASMVGFALLGLGVLPHYVLIEHAPKVGFAIGLALNSIGLWQRFKAMQEAHADNLDQQVAERTRELTQALENVKTLKGLIPICSACKSIRDDEGFWTRVETYIMERSEADFTHGICPDCMTELYGAALKKRTSSPEQEPGGLS